MARIDVIIGAKNKLKGALASASAQLKKFGNKAKAIGTAIGNSFKAIAKGIGVIGGAVAGFATAAVVAYSKQQDAEKQLASAMRAHGDNVDALLPKYKQLAAEIQDQTGIADESTLAMMAQLRTLGVSNEEMEKATKMTIAFKKAGMGADTALRASAAAIDGNTTMLTRYIPALRSAKDDAEKMQIVQDLATRGYQQQQEELDTTAGRYNELKGRIGDAMEEVGRAIVESTGFQGVLASVSEKVKELTKRFQDFVADGGIDRAIHIAKLFGVEFVASLERIMTYAKSFVNVVNKALVQPLKDYYDMIMNAVVPAGMAFGKLLKGDFKEAGRMAKESMDNAKDSIKGLFDVDNYKDYYKGIVDTIDDASDEIAKIETDKANKIDSITEQFNSDQLKKIEERKKAEEQVAKEASELANKQAEVAVQATEKIVEANEEKIESEDEYAKNVQKSIEALGEIGLSDITSGKSAQFKRALDVLSTAKPLPDLNIAQLKAISLGNITSGKARQFVRALDALRNAKKVPDLGLKQFEALSKINAKDVKDMLDALKGAQGAKIEFALGKDAGAHLKEIAVATKATAKNTSFLQKAVSLS